MVDKNTSNSRSNLKTQKRKKSRCHTWIIIAIALYITFLLLSTIAFSADRTVETNMKESYTYHLSWPKDGRQSHYYVERVDTSKEGRIDLTYTTASNTLVVDSKNIKVMHIFCRSMYEDECRKVYGIDPSDNTNYYKWYFIEKNHFNVNIESDSECEELAFIDTPLAYEVIVNSVKWKEGTDYFYKDNGGTALSHVPSGKTRVDLYFKPREGTPPTAILSASTTLASVNHTIVFDASQSYDLDGSISAYVLDFGDGTFRGGATHTYYYSKPGVYGVILTVRDNDNLISRAYANITIVESSDLPEIQGIIPNQVKPEDSPPWPLNLSMYEPIASTYGIEFYWYLTGENTSLYTVIGENDTEDRLIFTPISDAYGNNLVTLWLRSTENLTVSQRLWINITPVNDLPTISNLPDLIVHYDDPYTFNYEAYIFDKETPKNKLTLNIFDGYDNKYISVYGLNATFNYPHELVGEVIYTTVMVSDGEEMAQDVISIQVTSDHVPKLVTYLPDVWLFEGTTKYNVFDLDDYFTDPDNDAIYFSFGQTHLDIIINANHTVDISAMSEWTGNELVTFRARDPIGALAEDSIVVTVLPVNDPPVIEGIPNFFIRYDLDYKFDLTPYIHDNDNTTSELTIIPSDPEHIRLDIRNNLVIIMNYPVEYLDQSLPLRLTVFDGLDSSFQDISVTITDDFPPELLSPLPDVVFLEDMPLSNAFDLDNYFLDVDGDVLFFTTGNDFIDITINPDHNVDFSAPPDWFGTELAYFRATDPTGALQEDLVIITVLPVNDPPKILQIPPQYGNETERWILDLEPYVFDVDNNLSELEITVDSDFVVISGSKLIFLGSAELPDSVEVTISDGEFSATQMIEVHMRQVTGPRVLTLWDLLFNLLPFLILIIIIIAVIASAVYRKKTRFAAEEVFLIHKGGTLINHLTRHTKANIDDVIFSGMFTAVQEFIKDTFVQDTDQSDDSAEDSWVLDELKLGENKILIERSKNVYLAVIFSGSGSKRLRRIVNRLLAKIETKYAKILPTWDGNITKLAGTKKILSVLIKPLDEPKGVEGPKHIPKLQEPSIGGQFSTPYTTKSTPQVSGTKMQTVPLVKATTVPTTPLIKKRPPIKSKELLKCTGDLMGSNRPGLAAWKLNEGKGRFNITQKTSIDTNRADINQLPMALNIVPLRQFHETVAIKKPPQPPIARAHLTSTTPHTNGSTQVSAKPIKIATVGSDKKFKLDPSQPLLHQLAKFN